MSEKNIDILITVKVSHVLPFLFHFEFISRSLIDDLAQTFHSDPIVRKYIGNALQHQLASAVGKSKYLSVFFVFFKQKRFVNVIILGKAHWKLQERMREDCLMCHGMRYSKDLIEILIKGDNKCIAGLPTYMIDPLSDDKTNPEDIARIGNR